MNWKLTEDNPMAYTCKDVAFSNKEHNRQDFTAIGLMKCWQKPEETGTP